MDIIQQCGVVVDVGKEYDPIKYYLYIYYNYYFNRMRFDHHQRDFNETYANDFTTKLSSAGLIFKHFGKEVVQSLIPRKLNESEIKTICDRVYKIFIEQIDAADNGIDISECPKFQVSSSISQRVAKLNSAPRIYILYLFIIIIMK